MTKTGLAVRSVRYSGEAKPGCLGATRRSCASVASYVDGASALTAVALESARRAPAHCRADAAPQPTVLMLLSNHYGPDPRVESEIGTLREHGYHVRLLCWDRDFDRPQVEHLDGLSIRRLRIRSTHRRGLTQAAYLARYWAAAVAESWSDSVQLVHAHDFDTWPAGWAAARTHGAPLVLDVHDSFSDMMVGHLPRAACRALIHAENWYLRRADAVVTVGSRLGEFLSGRGATRVVILPNCKRPAEYQADDAMRRAFRARMNMAADQWCLGYLSHLGSERPIPAMIEAVAADPRVLWVVGGDGYHAEAIAEAARRHANIRYLGYVAPREIPALTACFDAVFCGYDPRNPNARFSAPNKLFEALAAGRPLLTGNYGEVGDILRQHECGVTVEQFTPELLRSALDRLACPRFRAAAGERARGLGQRHCNWDYVRHRLPRLYAELGVGASVRHA